MALKLNWKVTKLVTTTDLPSSGRVWWKIHLFQMRFSPRIQRLEEKIDIPWRSARTVLCFDNSQFKKKIAKPVNKQNICLKFQNFADFQNHTSFRAIFQPENEGYNKKSHAVGRRGRKNKDFGHLRILIFEILSHRFVRQLFVIF